MGSSSFHIKKNYLPHRIKSLQYEANSPCEDSIVYSQLKAVEAYTVSIFDGHGGKTCFTQALKSAATLPTSSPKS